MNEKDQVNRRNTRVWVKMNEDAKSSYFREQFVQRNGGKFIKKVATGNGLSWTLKN